jgi:nicotinate-nucleotide adenylyltransferase
MSLSGPTDTQRIIVFGGSFDPPHLGHLLHAGCAADALHARVLFVPVGSQPLKPDAAREEAAHRATMTELAITGDPRFVLHRADLDRPGPHYTVDMLRLIGGEFPGAALHLLMGADSLASFGRWRDPAGILAQSRITVVPRSGHDDTLAEPPDIPYLREKLDIIDAPHVDISSTLVAARVRAGRSIRYFVPPAVEAYIRENKLYERD